MATSYPTSKQSFTNPSGTSDTNVLDHGGMHTNTNDTLGALQDTVGYSADTATSILGRLSSITGSDVAVGAAATQTLLNKTLVAPVVNGSSGNLTISASSDGGEYNLNASATGTLAIYGAGGQTLHLNLLDGDLKTNSTTRLTNAGVLQNVSISGSSNTLTNIPGSALSTSAILLGRASSTTDFSTASTTSVQVTGLTASVTIPSGGRAVKITGFADSMYSSASAFLTLEIWDGTVGSGTRLASTTAQSTAAGQQLAALVQAHITPAAGNKTYNIGFKTTAGTAHVFAATTSPAFISVELI